MSRADDLFALASAIVLEEEGVFADDAQDPGGETWYGIARAAHPDLAPWPPSKEQALALYRAEYFDAHRCGEMPAHWAVAIFDAAVNPCGPVIVWAQCALNVLEDGKVGPQTLLAMNARFADDTYDLFFALRAEGYLRQPVFERGHLKRLFAVQRKTLERVLGLQGP
jgi:lysozyme family protein